MPTIEGSNVAGSFNYTHSTGWYTKVGNLVNLSLTVAASIGGTTPTGSLLVKNLPFTANEESLGSFQCNQLTNAYQPSVMQYTAIIQANNAHIHFRGTKTNGAVMDTLEVQTVSYLRTTISYRTAS